MSQCACHSPCNQRQFEKKLQKQAALHNTYIYVHMYILYVLSSTTFAFVVFYILIQFNLISYRKCLTLRLLYFALNWRTKMASRSEWQLMQQASTFLRLVWNFGSVQLIILLYICMYRITHWTRTHTHARQPTDKHALKLKSVKVLCYYCICLNFVATGVYNFLMAKLQSYGDCAA